MQHICYPEERPGPVQRPGLGLIHSCQDQGVGQSTRSLGLAIRVAAAGLRVFFVQLMKSGDSAEVKILAASRFATRRAAAKAGRFVIKQIV